MNRSLWLVAAFVASASCSDDSARPIPAPPTDTWTECQSTPQNFVRKAILAVHGRRAWGVGELQAYTDFYVAVESEGGDPREAVIRTLAAQGDYRTRWGDYLMDAMLVDRLNVLKQNYLQTKTTSCYRAATAQPADGGALAAWVRDNYPSATNPPVPRFDMGHLLSSTLELDDLSPLLRANLFALLRFPVAAPNVSEEERERIRRIDFGTAFETSYLRRDPGCLLCHNSGGSVTYDADEQRNRHWALPGLFEEALYGQSTGPLDALAARSVMRYSGVADVPNGAAPYGWNADACGRLGIPDADPLGVEVVFGSVRSTPENPRLGERASVWALDPALRRGVDLLASQGLVVEDDGRIADPDAAFAYLVGANIVEGVWSEVIGGDLTTVTGFPRSRVQRDTLKSLTDSFVANRFSLKSLLVEIAKHPAFNLATPETGCDANGNSLPTIFDAWTTVVDEDGRAFNTAADGIFPITSRTLRRGVHRAMGWEAPADFPEGEEVGLQSALGYFIGRAQHGSRGLSFEGRLAWENHYGACSKQSSAPDFVDELLQLAAATPGVTLADGIIALKDRLVNQARLDEEEAIVLEALLGLPLSSTDVTQWAEPLRIACGVLLQTPDLFLAGLELPDETTPPKLSLPSHDYAASCAVIETAAAAIGLLHSFECSNQ